MFTQNYPTLTGEVEVGRTIVNGINDKIDFIAELKLNFPLFEGFYVVNETRAAKSQLQIAKLQLQQLELEIEREVSNYREDIVLSLEAFCFAQQYVESAETDFRIQISKYKAGTTTIVDVINAQTEVANATAKYIATKRDYFTSLANLASAIGTLYRNQTLPQDEL
jgi:outer membrane protein TolC